MNLTELLSWSIVGGLAGTVLMDIAGIAGEKLNLTSGAR
jgi:hypothetical protein